MRTQGVKLTALLVVVLLVTGCAVSRPPLQRDETYPAEWPDISSLGSECKGLDGIYANHGIATDTSGTTHNIVLHNLLIRRSQTEAKALSLKVVTRRVDAHKDTFATLMIAVADDVSSESDETDCHCIKQRLFCPNVSPTYGPSSIILMSHFSQTDVWFTKATDGSLLVKIWDSAMGHILVVPYHKQSSAWARFKRIRE